MDEHRNRLLRKYYQNDLEDFSKFEDDGASESGKSLAAIELEEWEGKGIDFYHKFAGDPKRGGVLYIRETEESYSAPSPALDDNGNKEAMLRFSKGKYHGTISKWDEDGNLWEESEFDRGTLVAFTIKNGKPFDPTEVIDLSEDEDMVNLLFLGLKIARPEVVAQQVLYNEHLLIDLMVKSFGSSSFEK